MYYFSELALTLNAWEAGTAPTDSRLRPDQRLMENGRWDEANAEKQRLEEKQRLSRKKREAEAMKATEDGSGRLLLLFLDAGERQGIFGSNCFPLPSFPFRHTLRSLQGTVVRAEEGPRHQGVNPYL